MFRHRMWFCIPFVVGGLFEIIGYVGRALAYNSTGELIPYVLQSTLLLLGPVLFAASLYMTLSRVIRGVNGGHCSLIAPRWLTRIFVFGDVFSFIIQASGAGLRVQAGMGKSSIDPNLGSNVIVGGLIFQIIIFGLFIVTTAMFNMKFQKDPMAANAHDIPWQSTLGMLYMTSAFVMIRNIFRVAEYAMGSDGYLLGVEWGVYVFDAALMTLTMAAYLWRYPSKLRPIIKDEEARDVK
ncbi:hypothetical protein Daus18300_011580 [Diaporthe australafricana]|uniref:RTA1 like protein n=1 Tax=Diaporthe australafricana TaxID=127596 RepID=A0ABR3W5V2_9PEZI